MTSQSTTPPRITARPDAFNGKPIVRDLRISVELILSLIRSALQSGAVLTVGEGRVRVPMMQASH